jgi:hypothetical protein
MRTSSDKRDRCAVGGKGMGAWAAAADRRGRAATRALHPGPIGISGDGLARSGPSE